MDYGAAVVTATVCRKPERSELKNIASSFRFLEQPCLGKRF